MGRDNRKFFQVARKYPLLVPPAGIIFRRKVPTPPWFGRRENLTRNMDRAASRAIRVGTASWSEPEFIKSSRYPKERGRLAS